MVSATVDSPSDHLRLELIATVDLRFLSQSELYALSLCSDNAFDPRRCDDVVIPKIDRSVFNESAGSRKQTYSRLRLAPRKPESSAIPRRTPHLRAPKSAIGTTDDGNPERGENTQIIGLLKNLFTAETNGDELVPIRVEAAETNGDELVPIRVEYSDSVPNLPNVVTNGKRKRGRPRKNENLAVFSTQVAEGLPVEVRTLGDDNVIKDIVVHENIEERDKEIVNKNGNIVDLAALASLDDPYGLELERRTEKFTTEEELLGFLTGLNGQWVSRRRKKRIVDASEFGDALPKGWKLLLSLKKKESHVWLFVRRYISPNGRQFMSCKEISSYLLSLFGLQDPNQPNHGQNNENIQLTYKRTCENVFDLWVMEQASDLAAKEISKRGDLVNNRADLACHSPSGVTYVSSDQEKQVNSEVVNFGKIQTVDILRCDKCTMTFNKRDDLLQHLLSSHRRKRSRFGTSITDGVIIKGGQYECQFCHKTFNAMNRYNGHVGAHKRHHLKGDEVSPGVLSSQNTVDPVSLSGVPPNESMVQTSILEDFNSATCNANANSDPKLASPQYKLKAGSDIESYTDRSTHEASVLSHGEQDSKSYRNERDFPEEICVEHSRENCLGRLDESNDVAAKFNLCLDSEVAMSDSEIHSRAVCTASRIDDHSAGQGRSLASYLHSPFANEKTCGAEVSLKSETVNMDGINQESGSDSVSIAPHGSEKNSGNVYLEDISPMESSKFDTEKFDNKQIHDFCNTCAGPDGDVSEGKQQNGPGGSSVLGNNAQKNGDFNNVITVSASALSESKQKRCPESSDEETCGVKYIHGIPASSAFKPKIDPACNSGIKEAVMGCGRGHSGVDEDTITRVEQDNSESCLLVESWKNQLCDMEDNADMISGRTMEEHEEERGPESCLHVLSGYHQTCEVKNVAGTTSTGKLEEPKLDKVQGYRNNELNFGIIQSGMNTEERTLEFGSLVLSGNEQTFVEENMPQFSNSTQMLSKQKGTFDNSWLTHSCTEKTFDDVYNMNMVSSSTIKDSKPAEARNSCNGELIHAFGSNAPRIDADVMTNLPIGQTFSFETNLSGENNRTLKDSKQDSSMLGPLFYAKTSADENNLNRVEAIRVWEGPMMDDVINSGPGKLTIGFGSISAQSDGDVLPGSLWRTDEGNILQSTLADTSIQEEQCSSFFPTFSVVRDKGEHDLLRVNSKYDSVPDFGGAQSSHTEQVEFSFLTMQNLNSLPENSKTLSYNTEMGHGFDSSFWLEKDALSLNIAARNQVTSRCVWCRNEFHHEPLQPGTQTGAIGSICPTCSAKVPQRFNVF